MPSDGSDIGGGTGATDTDVATSDERPLGMRSGQYLEWEFAG